ncbi:MAG: FAD-dependent thymidylate synthase [Pseudomonadota bacterium]
MNHSHRSGPQIYLISRPEIDLNAIELFLRRRDLDWARTKDAHSPEELVEFAGRVCYLSFTKDTAKVRYPNSRYIENLIQQGHESVLEHATWTFVFDGVSRAFTHQLVRHRIGFSYSQLSQQYFEDDAFDPVEPVELAEHPELREIWRASIESAREAYRRLLKGFQQSLSSRDKESLRSVRSAARTLLPNATATAIVVTANARALRHFLDLRGAIAGDSEMRAVCVRLLEVLRLEAPELFSDFQIVDTDDSIGSVAKVDTSQ